MTMNEQILRILDVVFRVGVGGMFIYAAWSKIQDPALFARSVAGFQMLPPILVSWVAIVLPMLELMAGVALTCTKWSREASFVIEGMLLIFMVGLSQAAIRGLDISCGCFGEGKAEGPGHLWWLVGRDALLQISVIWLLRRPNGWLFGRLRPKAAWVLLLAGMASGMLWAQETSAVTNAVTASATVKVGVWTKNFPVALAHAREEHRPLVLYVGRKGCEHCARLKAAFATPQFKTWSDMAGVYLVKANFTPADKTSPQGQANVFAAESPHQGHLDLPYVCVYWPKTTNDEIRTVFTGRRRSMPGKKHMLLLGDFVCAMDELLGDYLKTRPIRPTEDYVFKKTMKVVVEGEGRVFMRPSSGIVNYGGRVEMVAVAGEGMEFVGWRFPNGKIKPPSKFVFLGENAKEKRLSVTYDDDEGSYVAIFQKINHVKETPRED